MTTADGSADPDGGAQRERPRWKKARLPELASSTTADDALADIVQGCVEHLRGNEQCLLERTHEEGVHQMRVAVRRLRSCLALYEGLIPAEQGTHITGELKWLIRELGPARDWDVFVAEVLAPVLKQMRDEDRLVTLAETVEGKRAAAYERAQAAVGSQRYVGLVLLLGAWAEGRGWRDAKAPEAQARLQENAQSIAHHLLDGIYDQLLSAAEGFETLDAESRHKVRIHLKKLRYATEFFASLYSRRRVTPYLAAMKSLQDALGTSNDVEVARKLLKQVIKPARGKERARIGYAAGLVVGWHSHVGDGREQDLIRAWTAFANRAPYWGARATPAAGTAVHAAETPDAIDAPEAAEPKAAASPSPSAEAPVVVGASPASVGPAAPPRRRRVVRHA